MNRNSKVLASGFLGLISVGALVIGACFSSGPEDENVGRTSSAVFSLEAGIPDAMTDADLVALESALDDAGIASPWVCSTVWGPDASSGYPPAVVDRVRKICDAIRYSNWQAYQAYQPNDGGLSASLQSQIQFNQLALEVMVTGIQAGVVDGSLQTFDATYVNAPAPYSPSVSDAGAIPDATWDGNAAPYEDGDSYPDATGG